MFVFILRRLLTALGTLLLLSYGVWLLTTRDGIIALHHLSLDNLLPSHYLVWLNRVLHGDLGYSIRTAAHTPVLAVMRDGLLTSLLVLVPAFILQQLLAFGLGVLAGSGYRGAFDRIFTSASFAFIAIPPFWLALLVIIIFSTQLHVLPFNGLVSIGTTGAAFNTPDYWTYFHAHTLQEIGDIAKHLTMPILVLAVTGAAVDGQYVRLALVEVLSQEYIRSAKARGLRQRAILWKHALRNAVLPLITNIGTQLPRLVFAAAIIELLFGLPGIGRLFASAVYTPPNSLDARQPPDYDVVTAYFLVLGVVTVLSSLLTDLAYALADPRIRDGQGSGTAAAAIDTAPQPVLTMGRVTVTAGQLVVAATTLVALVIGVLTARQLLTPPPTISGTWVGSAQSTGGSAYPAAMVVRVAANGNVSGTGLLCYGNLGFGASEEPFTVQGTDTSAISIHLTWAGTANDQLDITGALSSDQHALTLTGNTLQGGFPPAAINLHLAKGSLATYHQACAQRMQK